MEAYSSSASRNENENENVRRYGLAIFAAIIALLLRQLLTPLLGESYPYHTLWAATVFCAWYCGIGPSILAALAGVVGIWYWFLPPVQSFRLQDPKTEISGILGFLLFAGLIIALGEANRRSLARSKWTEEQLRKAHDELEQRVQERTAELNMANEDLRELSGRLQQIRDEERRQIARELHDSAGQLLAALGMNIAVIQSQSHKLDEAGVRAASENGALIQQISREIRIISHLLHPPLLDVAGLASALRWYVDGFSERSKIKVDVDIAIFRMIQECLTNIHRHSGGAAAAIRVHEEDRRVLVEVQDTGKGIPLEKQLELSSSGRIGVGFRGMRERLRQLGGTLEIRSDGGGTVVIATLPIVESKAARGASEQIAS
jgi:signal transduction histidine kinase